MQETHPRTLNIYTSTNPLPGSRYVPQYRILDTISYTVPAAPLWIPKSEGMDGRYRVVIIYLLVEVSGASMDISLWWNDTKIGGKNVNVSLD